MRRNWLARAVATAAAISVPVTASVALNAGAAQAATVSSQQRAAAAKAAAWDAATAKYAKRLIGDPYEYGGTSTRGFDCSGLTQYVYRHTSHGRWIRRTAQDQFREFKRIPKRDARAGDLVFFHDTSSPGSYVYHVGVYEGHGDMVAATTSGGRVEFQSFAWAGDTVTFGTITHS
jgi:cell wall-associated NlpC family hydrolase